MSSSFPCGRKRLGGASPVALVRSDKNRDKNGDQDAPPPTLRLAASTPVPRVVRPHVCFVAPQVWPVLARDSRIPVVGGAEVQQTILGRLLVRAGYQVSMICLDYGQPEQVTVDGITVHRAHSETAGIPVLRFFHPRLTSMWRAMAEVDADIYYQRSAAMLTAVVAVFCRRHGKRSIYAGAADSDFKPGQQIIRYGRDRWLFERGLALVDRVVVQNEQQRLDCLHHYGRAAQLIPSCYELPEGSHPGPGEFILWAATVRPDKRPELFLDLARRLPQRRFVLVGGAGEGRGARDYYDSIRQAATALPNVEVTGFLPLAEAEAYFDRAQVVVNTSPAEGMPNIFLQAWARGIPTVAYIDVGARSRGEAVYRVVANEAEAAGEVERLCADDIYRAHASARCRDYFAATHGSAAVLGLYGRLLAELGGVGGGEP
ncbi:MAG TPA: glycosyltransferase family 4 protein [Azospira sp.]|nr:glycosyltransferase family 4 protein [Azospira sp.]